LSLYIVRDWNGEPSTADGDDCGIISFAGAYYIRSCRWSLSYICEKLATGANPNPYTPATPSPQVGGEIGYMLVCFSFIILK